MMKSFLFILFFFVMNYPGKRQVLIFYNQQGSVYKNKQLALLNQKTKGVKERDIEIHTYEISAAKEEGTKYNIAASEAFTFILVGKDGDEKLRTDTVVNPEQLFATIDAMPMRKQEMKHSK